jgi:serine/threonine protein phosphatase PrpC
VRLNADHSIPARSNAAPGTSNLLRSALGGQSIAMIDWRREAYALEEGDVILAASDGLLTLSLPEIASHLAVLTAENAVVIANELLRLVKAKAKVNQDNVTVGIMKVSAPSPR